MCLFMAALGLCSSKAQAFSSCGEWAYSAVHGLLIEVASLVAKHRIEAHGLNRGTRA